MMAAGTVIMMLLMKFGATAFHPVTNPLKSRLRGNSGVAVTPRTFKAGFVR